MKTLIFERDSWGDWLGVGNCASFCSFSVRGFFPRQDKSLTRVKVTLRNSPTDKPGFQQITARVDAGGTLYLSVRGAKRPTMFATWSVRSMLSSYLGRRIKPKTSFTLYGKAVAA